jgi:nitric oxide reductase subunit B
MKRLWIGFSLVMVLSFLVLGWIGTRIYQEMPPIPARVVTTEGTVLIAEGEIPAGQNVWQSLGGMQVGSIWGHGSYVAPDWTADWLHREAIFILDRWALADFKSEYAKLDGERQAQLQGRLAKEMRTNTYDSATGAITISPIRAEAFHQNFSHETPAFRHGVRK